MKALAKAALLVLVASQVATATPVPGTINFTARLVDDKTDALVTGSHHAVFALFDAETAGNSLWTETRDVSVEDGLLFVDLGATTTLDAATLDGRKLFLQVTFDDVVMEPRVAIGSVPYALRSTDADSVGGMPLDGLQKRITGSCGTGNFIIAVNDDGTVSCAPDLSGSGDITDVIAGNGLAGGGPSGSVTLSLINCGQGEVLKFQGSVWACAADSNSGGDITSVTVGAAGGLSGGGNTGDIQLSLLTTCAAGQILKFNGAAWGCAADVDTNSGGTITGITTSGTSGLVGGGTSGNLTLSLLTSCGNNQVLKFSTATGAWGCANDIDTDSGGDITAIVAGNGLTGDAASGSATLNVGAGTGITVAADTVALDTAFTDTRYDNRYNPKFVDVGGDTMTGTLDMGNNRIVSRGCQVGYVRHGGLCLEDVDVSSLTFSACANRCRAANAHIPSSGEMRAAMQSGTTIGNGGVIGDWVDDMDTTTNVFVINSGTDTNNWISVAQTGTAQFCRCATNVE